MKFSASFRPRIVLPPLAAAGAVLAASAIAADRPGPAAAERWALRPIRGAEPAPVPVLRGSKSIPLSDLPGERRAVRVVYQGYGALPPSEPER